MVARALVGSCQIFKVFCMVNNVLINCCQGVLGGCLVGS